MPVIRGGPLLVDAIKSVVDQSMEDWEIVCVQNRDGIDLSEEVALDPRIRLVQEPSPGVPIARNRGLAEARGKYVALLDEDDRWRPQKLARQVDMFEAQPTITCCHTNYVIIGADGAFITHLKNSQVTYEHMLTVSAGAHTSSLMYEASALRDIGGFDESLRMAEDFELLLRTSRRGPYGYVPEVLSEYRWHHTQMSRDYVLGTRVVLSLLAQHRRLAIADRDWTNYRLSVLGTIKVRTAAASTAYLRGTEAYSTKRSMRAALASLARSLRFNPAVLAVRTAKNARGYVNGAVTAVRHPSKEIGDQADSAPPAATRPSQTADLDGRSAGAPDAPESLNLRRGEWVRLRRPEEIASTLDENLDSEGLPFMPEMLQLRGRHLQIAARVTKTCDTIDYGPMRTMPSTVHLVGARCDGSSHGGCEAGCLMYFKESWLERVADADAMTGTDEAGTTRLAKQLETAAQVGPDTYRCQATQILAASEPREGFGHYLEDVRTGNAPLPKLLKGLAWALINKYQRLSTRLPEPLRYGSGEKVPLVTGRLTKTPTERLDLQAGELVEVKSPAEIEATLDRRRRNRGLSFDREMLPYCGERMRVARRVSRIVDEKTGALTTIKGDCIVLEGAVCQGIYSTLCPREIPAYWREIWLRRIAGAGNPGQSH